MPSRLTARTAVWRALAALTCLAASAAAEPSSSLMLTNGARLAVLGDENSYARFVEDYLLACAPPLRARVFQMGRAWEMTAAGAARLDTDVLPFHPDVVCVSYGLDDAQWQAYDEGRANQFEADLRKLVAQLKQAGVHILVGSPGGVDTRYFPWNGYGTACVGGAPAFNECLARLGGRSKSVAAELGFRFADLHAPLVTAMEKAKAALGRDYDVCGTTGFQPNLNGQLVEAGAVLKALGFDGDIGAITVDLKGGATATAGHRVISCHDGSVELESDRWPFCFSGDAASSGWPRSILPYTPFNQELNRLTLVVKNLDAPQARVRWGNAEKVFTRETLEKGINLAAEFLDNPFLAQFCQLDQAVAKKQAADFELLARGTSNFAYYLEVMKHDPAAQRVFGRLREKMYEQQAQQVEMLRSMVQPVKHTVVVTPVKEAAK